MTELRNISAILLALMALVPVVIVVASVLFRGRGRRRSDGGPGRRDVGDRDGE